MSDNNEEFVLHTINDCLKALGIDDPNATFSDCDDLEKEFVTLKKIYFAKILVEHPDKGGCDPALFRKTQAAFDVLRDRKTKGRITSFMVEETEDDDSWNIDIGEEFAEFYREFSKGATPSYEYYYEAAQEEMPGYRVEFAKSARSQCVKCKPKNGAGRGRKRAASAATAASVPLLENGDTKENNVNKKEKASQSVAIVPATTTTTATSIVKAKGPYIGKDELRVGSLDERSGSYGRWNHVSCWRVPYRIWAGLTNPKDSDQVFQDLCQMEEILLTGISELAKEEHEQDRKLFVVHVMNDKNWARKTKRSKAPPDLERMRREQEQQAEAVAKESAEQEASKENTKEEGKQAVKSSAKAKLGKKGKKKSTKKASKKRATEATGTVASAAKKPKKDTDQVESSTELATVDNNKNETAVAAKKKTKTKFNIPRPGVNGAIADIYAGKRFVLTGIFPEVGGGAGLNLGKDRVRAMIEDFGGRVTGSVSGKTDFLLVGKEPGQSKVRQAKDRHIPLVDLKSLSDNIYGTLPALKNASAPAIKQFSAGYPSSFRLGY